MKYSIYCYAFNVTLRDYDLEGAIENFIKFVGDEGEVVCATIKSEDNTAERLAALTEKFKNFVVVESKLDITKTNRWDGMLKTEAMNACKNKLRIIADIDERFLLDSRLIWDRWSEILLNHQKLDGLLIPVIDLYKGMETIKSNGSVGQKFRLHKDTVYARGVPSFAELEGGLFRTDMSDSTEPIDINGGLCNFVSIVNATHLMPLFVDSLKSFPYVLHFGFLDLERRAKLGATFWKSEWEKRSGKEENVATSKIQLEQEPVIMHGLKIEPI